MKKLHTGALTAVALVMGFSAQAASAQGLRGIRAEGQVGLSSFHSEGNSKSKIGYGAAVGADFDLGGFVLGAEGTFWNARAENRTIDGPGLAEHKTFEEYGIAARAGVMVTPATLVYGKVGYVRNEQRKRFTPLTAGGALNSAAPGYYYDHFKTNGIQYGGGIEQMLFNNFYAKAEGRYSDYKNHTHTITGLIGLGVLFGAAAPVEEVVPVAPPPPPAPEAPATQTCPDGSVILATSTCPAPPPPPPAPVERGERG